MTKINGRVVMVFGLLLISIVVISCRIPTSARTIHLPSLCLAISSAHQPWKSADACLSVYSRWGWIWERADTFNRLCWIFNSLKSARCLCIRSDHEMKTNVNFDLCVEARIWLKWTHLHKGTHRMQSSVGMFTLTLPLWQICNLMLIGWHCYFNVPIFRLALIIIKVQIRQATC